MDDDDRDDSRGGFLRLERGRRQPNPNIVYIISDDQGWRDVGYHGSDIKTTNINTLAQGGARLEQFYAPCTLHVFAAGLIGRLAGRASLPGATFCPLCHEYLGGDACPGGLAAMQVRRGVAPGAPVQGLIGIAAARAKSGDSIMSNDVRFFAGVDWATETHQVCIVEAQGGKIIGERAFPHGGEGLAAQLDRFRDRFTVAGAKDDRRDAHVLGDSLRTDRRAFRRLSVEDPTVIELREWSRIADDLTQERTRLANRIRQQLWRYYPQMLQLADDVTAENFLALFECAPTPARAAEIDEASLAKVLKAHR